MGRQKAKAGCGSAWVVDLNAAPRPESSIHPRRRVAPTSALGPCGSVTQTILPLRQSLTSYRFD